MNASCMISQTALKLAAQCSIVITALAIAPVPVAAGPAPRSLSSDIARYRSAHDSSRLLRNEIHESHMLAQQELALLGNTSPASHDRIRHIKSWYIEIRAILFSTTYAHAAAAVESASTRPFEMMLTETALTLASASDLVLNADAIMSSILADEPTRRIWNDEFEPDKLPAGKAGEMVAADLHVHVHDLFQAGLPKLTRHRPDLEQAYQQPPSPLRELFTEGVGIGLDQIARAKHLLHHRIMTYDLAEDESQLRALVKQASRERALWRQELASAQQRLDEDKGIVRGDVHVQLIKIKRSFLDLRERLYPLAFKHIAILTRDDLDYPPALRLHAVALSSLAAGVLYENATLLQEVVSRISGMKDLLNQADPSQGIPNNFWDHIEHEYANPNHRLVFKAGLQVLETNQANPGGTDPFLDYVADELSAMTAVSEIQGEPIHSRYGRLLKYYESRAIKTGISSLTQGKIQTSKGFGNAVGMIEFRKGKLYDQPQWINFVSDRVEPGDILLEKTPFRVTDKFIPGHFGHVALYIGTPTQLKALGLWNHPAIIPYHTQLLEGRTIVEALRDGTQINTIAHFLNIDDLAILRPKPGSIPKDDVLQAIHLAFTHIGKQYDFGFDTNTWDTIVCSELAFQTYVNVRWPFGKTLGSYTISPDDVALMASSSKDHPFHLLSFLHDGALVSDDKTGVRGESFYRHLIEPKPSVQAGLFQLLPNPLYLFKSFGSGGRP